MKKLLLYTNSLMILLVFSACKTQYSKNELNTNFTTEQINDLNKITEFFKEETCKNADFKKCYLNSNHDSLLAVGKGFWSRIDFEKQKQLYQRISKSTFDEIWIHCESTYYPSKTKAEDICAVATGKYQKYLTDLGKTNPRIEKYAKRIQASGDFNGLDIQYHEILKSNSDFDLNDPNIQLILAIHYLSINDHAKRNAHLIERKEPKFN